MNKAQIRDDLVSMSLYEASDDDEVEDEHEKITICLSSEKYEINFMQFCKYSHLIYSAFINKKNIHEIIANIEQSFPKYHIKDESVKTFFKLLNNEQAQITSDEYIDLCKLSELFKVKSLKKLLKKYSEKLSENIQFLLNILINQNSNLNENYELFSNDYFPNDIEIILSKHVNEFLICDKVNKLPISTIYRIIEKSDHNEIKSDILYDFIMKSIEERFLLFRFVDIKNLNDEIIAKISENESSKFFECIPNNFLYIRELIENKRKIENENEKLKIDVKQLESDKIQSESKNQEFQKIVEKLKEEIKQQKERLNELEAENNQIKIEKQKTIEKLEEEIKQQKERLNKLDAENSQIKIENRKIVEKLEEENQQQKERLNKLEEENKKKVTEMQKTIETPNTNAKFTKNFNGNNFNGIFNELTQQCNGNICDKGIINITGNKDNDSPSFSTIVDFNYNKPCYFSKNEPNSFVCFDFKNNLVSVSAYSIKNTNYDYKYYLRSWFLEGSNDGNEWTVLDSHSNDIIFNSISSVFLFNIQDESKKKQKFKFIKLRMTGQNAAKNNFLDLFNIELFGSYY